MNPPSQTTVSPAPADRFSLERVRLTELSTALATLRKQLPPPRRLMAGAHQGVLSAGAALIAYLPTQPLGLREGFWSAITAITVVQAEFEGTHSSARDQFIGAAIGGSIGVCASVLFGEHLLTYAAAIMVSVLTAWLFNIASASRLAGVTATIVLLVPHTGSAVRMFESRLFEVGWGVCAAIATVWIAARLPAKLWMTREHRVTK